jgi:5S rRNA maturation endonuclease (ribonuclease M5)
MTLSPSPTVESFLAKLNGVRKTGSGWQARCPCRNDDDNPSLSVGQGDDGRVLVNCHRGNGCSVTEVCTSLGMKVTDLYPPRQEERKLTLVATYEYRDKDGKVIYQKQRFVDQWGKKTFRQRRQNPDNPKKWVYSLDDVERVLYRLPEIIQARETKETVWLVEGEKDADNLVKLGWCATTPPNGAGKWQESFTDTLRDMHVFVVADNDLPGWEHAKDISERLKKAGCTVSTFVPPKQFKDVSELLAGGGKLEDLIDLKDAEPLSSATEIEEEKEEADIEAVSEVTSSLGNIASQITRVLMRDDLSEDTRIARANMLLNQIKSENDYDRGKLVNWQEFLDEPSNEEFDWVIDGLIERGERIMVVAAEGVGKTMLARQVAICSAAGLHPFNFSRIKPIRTLTIDLENPERIIRRTSSSIMGAARRFGYSEKVDAHLLIKPAGVDLLRAEDRAIIEETVERVRPDLLFIGPVYKAFVDPGGRTSEAVAVQVARYFDMLRDYYKCAMWLEHHAPLGSSMSTRDLRPFGSAVWSRWPEFGLSLHPDPTAVGEYFYDVRHFRGARDERPFPTKLKRGKVFPFELVDVRDPI